AILRAQGEREARILQAEGQAKAIQTVFNAVHAADPDPKVLAYQYLQALPQIANGQANKIWIIPAEMTKALEGIGNTLTGLLPGHPDLATVPPPTENGEVGPPTGAINEALEAAKAAAAETEEEARKGLPRLTAGEPVTPSSVLDPATEREPG